jgi:hypothetical protein
VEIPDGVLPAGPYVFTFSDSNPNHPVVRIYDQVSSILVATLQTVPNYRTSFPPQAAISFDEHRPPNPSSVRAWFPLRSRLGQGFVYLTHEHQRFFVPLEQPAASLQDWQYKATQTIVGNGR